MYCPMQYSTHPHRQILVSFLLRIFHRLRNSTILPVRCTRLEENQDRKHYPPSSENLELIPSRDNDTKARNPAYKMKHGATESRG